MLLNVSIREEGSWIIGKDSVSRWVFSGVNLVVQTHCNICNSLFAWMMDGWMVNWSKTILVP